MKRRITVISVLTACMLMFAAFAVSCGKTQDNPPAENVPVTIVMDETVEICVYESTTIRATVSGSDEKIVFSSRNPEIAEVNADGVVVGKAAGNARIAATVGRVTQTCLVTVKESPFAATIELGSRNVFLCEGDEYETDVATYWNGLDVSDEAEYRVTVAEGCSATVASARCEDGKIKLSGLSDGETAFVISAVVRGVLVAERIDVTVQEVQG